MILINKKNYFIIKLKNNFFYYDYLYFLDQIYNNYNKIEVHTKIFRILKKEKYINFLKKNFILNKTYVNNKKNLITFLGYFISDKYKDNILNNKYYYSNNYKLFTFIIHINIIKFKLILLLISFKILYILNLILKLKINMII